jgi:hypothetical protein
MHCHNAKDHTINKIWHFHSLIVGLVCNMRMLFRQKCKNFMMVSAKTNFFSRVLFKIFRFVWRSEVWCGIAITVITDRTNDVELVLVILTGAHRWQWSLLQEAVPSWTENSNLYLWLCDEYFRNRTMLTCVWTMLFLTYIIILVIVCDCYATSNLVLIRKIIVSCVPMKVGCVRAANLSTTFKIKRPLFWDITPCSMLKVSRRFGGTCLLYQAAQRSAC